MKYSININQAGIADAGLADHTDLSDWAILDYIHDWSRHPQSLRMGDAVWVDYKHMLHEMPLLGLKTKSAITKRLVALEKLGLIACQQDHAGRKYVQLTAYFHDVMTFRARSPQETGCFPQETQPLPTGNGAVSHRKHRTEYQLTGYQEPGTKEQKDSARAREVFEYWQEVAGHPRTKLDDKRKRKIRARLRDGYTVDELRAAVDGVLKSPFHMGENDHNMKYDDIELICRDAAHVDRFMRLADQPDLSAFSKNGRQNVTAAQRWLQRHGQ